MDWFGMEASAATHSNVEILHGKFPYIFLVEHVRAYSQESCNRRLRDSPSQSQELRFGRDGSSHSLGLQMSTVAS
jgi:hypothetical protein